MDKLPCEIISSIGKYLSRPDAVSMALSCKWIHNSMISRLWNTVKIRKWISKEELGMLTNYSIRVLDLTSIDLRNVPIKMIQSMSSLTNLSLRIERRKDVVRIKSFKNCSFTLHLCTRWISRSVNTWRLIKYIKPNKNIRLCLCCSTIDIGLDKLEFMIGIRVGYLSTEAIHLYNYTADVTTLFIQLVSQLRPSSIDLHYPPDFMSRDLLIFEERHLEIIREWPIRRFHTMLLGYDHGMRLPIHLIDKLTRIVSSLKTIYVRFDCVNEIKVLCAKRDIDIVYVSY